METVLVVQCLLASVTVWIPIYTQYHLESFEDLSKIWGVGQFSQATWLCSFENVTVDKCFPPAISSPLLTFLPLSCTTTLHPFADNRQPDISCQLHPSVMKHLLLLSYWKHFPSSFWFAFAAAWTHGKGSCIISWDSSTWVTPWLLLVLKIAKRTTAMCEKALCVP